jgi:hypothetical protein
MCSAEIPAAETERLIKVLGEVKIELIVTNKGVTNGGHICELCQSRVVLNGTREYKYNKSVSLADALKTTVSVKK